MTAAFSIEIVLADRGWILEQIANYIYEQSLLHPDLFEVRIVDKPTDNVDLTFFLPQSAYRSLKNSTTVTYFAHKEEHTLAASLFEQVATETDVCITSSTKYQKILEAQGAAKVYKLHLGVDTERFTPLLKIGVVGRTYHTNRKGEWLLAEINNMPMIELRFTGEGWPLPAKHYSTEALALFYQEIDYLLIPSLIEGGPVPMLEALSSGCQVIAPTDIGLVEDFPHIPFKLGDAKDLKRVIEEQLKKKLALRESVQNCDWKIHAERTLEIFSEIIDTRKKESSTRKAKTRATSTKPKILLLTHGSENQAKGGPSTRIRFIQNILTEQGYTVERKHGVTSVDELSNFDIVHVFNSWSPSSSTETMSLARRAGKKIVFSPIALDLQNYPIFQQFLEHILSKYDLDTIEKVIDALPSLMSTKLKNTASLNSYIEGITGHFEALRRCCQLADSIICLSNHERNFLDKIGVDTTSSTIVQNGIDFDFATNVNQDLFREKFNLNNYVLCVGRIEFRKNQALLAHALKDKDVSLVLLGGVSDTLYLDRVKSLGGNNLVHIPRIEDRTLLASAYLGASAFVLPSWCEGAPMSALEAGICGAPLVLSDMSSEREYFGDHAHYVSPANTDEIANAIDTAMQEHADESKRQARVELVQNEFSAKLHVQKTLEVYKRALEIETKQDSQEILLDVSAMLHYYRIDQHLTGIPLAERNIVSEIMKVQPDTRCLVYNGSIGRFIEIPFSVFSNFDSESFNKRYWFSGDQIIQGTDEKYDSHYFCKLTSRPAITAPPNLTAAQEKKKSVLRRMASHGYQQLNKFTILTPILRRIKNGLYMGVHYYRKGRNRLIARHPLGKSKVGIDTSNLSQYFDIEQLPKEALKINPGSRIISLGQGWLSNEPLLNELVRIAAGNKLEAYVYDISYITGSHFSGWNDNQDRQRRLDKLLKNCSTVFTESKITASELAKYGNSRSFNYQVVRTKLRGKDLLPAKKFGSSGSKTKFILYVASFNRRKNHDFIVNVWKDLQQSANAISDEGIKLYLVGEIQGETKYGDLSLRKHLKQFNIEVLGGVSEEKLVKYYQNCLFTIFPSLQEGWGIPVEESLMYAKVCLTSNAVPAAHEISNPALIKLAPHDFFGWREALITWVSNVKMREEFSKRAEKYVPIEWKTITECILSRRNIED